MALLKTRHLRDKKKEKNICHSYQVNNNDKVLDPTNCSPLPTFIKFQFLDRLY